jgi:hypothetical protein
MLRFFINFNFVRVRFRHTTPRLGAATFFLLSTAPVRVVSIDSLSGALEDPGGGIARAEGNAFEH